MPRKLQSASISFGLVTIPVDLYSAVNDQDIHFHQVHGKCGTRIKQQLFCPTCERVVERSELVKGYQISKGDLVTFTQDELDKLEAAESTSLEIVQFVPLTSVDPIYFEDTYFLGPNKGGEKPYHLLAQAMEHTQRVGLAKFVWRGKENLYLVRPALGGLMLHRMYYADEVRDFAEIPKGQGTVTEQEMKLATQLIETISQPEFQPNAFHDEYRQRVLDMIEQKAEGKEVTIQPKPKPAPVLDLMQKLRESLQQAETKPQKQVTALPARGERPSRKRAHAGRK
jgi:DNA end-binding protein Ku